MGDEGRETDATSGGGTESPTGLVPIEAAKLGRRTVESLVAAKAAYNPRRISDEAKAGLRSSLRRWGLVDLPVLNVRTGVLVAGHQRVDLLADEGLGKDEIDVVLVDVDPHDERALNVALNSPKIAGEFTPELQPILLEIDAFDQQIFEDLRLDDLLVELRDDPDFQPDMAGGDERLDRVTEMECPHCGKTFPRSS